MIDHDWCVDEASRMLNPGARSGSEPVRVGSAGRRVPLGDEPCVVGDPRRSRPVAKPAPGSPRRPSWWPQALARCERIHALGPVTILLVAVFRPGPQRPGAMA